MKRLSIGNKYVRKRWLRDAVKKGNIWAKFPSIIDKKTFDVKVTLVDAEIFMFRDEDAFLSEFMVEHLGLKQIVDANYIWK